MTENRPTPTGGPLTSLPRGLAHWENAITSPPRDLGPHPRGHPLTGV